MSDFYLLRKDIDQLQLAVFDLQLIDDQHTQAINSINYSIESISKRVDDLECSRSSNYASLSIVVFLLWLSIVLYNVLKSRIAQKSKLSERCKRKFF